jgi:hypothetical protein
MKGKEIVRSGLCTFVRVCYPDIRKEELRKSAKPFIALEGTSRNSNQAHRKRKSIPTVALLTELSV